MRKEKGLCNSIAYVVRSTTSHPEKIQYVSASSPDPGGGGWDIIFPKAPFVGEDYEAGVINFKTEPFIQFMILTPKPQYHVWVEYSF
jgi:hypothetical protein